MFRPTTLLAMAALSTSLAAEDFGPVVKAATLIYQGKTHFGVICNYGRSQDQVADLQRALPDGSTLTVVDVHHPMQVNAASATIVHRGVQLLALMPNDPLIRDGSPFATALVHRFNGSIPAFGTSPAALENGCALALGRATNWELMINPKLLDPALKGTIGPIEITSSPRGTMRGPATLDLVFQYR
ncbi:MAG TPA: hypothetical protein VGK03_01770 [Geothrix sp.]|jgi:hypothetical protein